MKSLLIALIFCISPLFADGPGMGGFDPMVLILWAAIGAIFYFMLIRPQQKKARIHQEMVKELRRGDRVVLSGGIFGTIDKVISDAELSVEIAENVKVRVVKATVTEIIAKTHPVASKAESNTPAIETKKGSSINKDNEPTITNFDKNTKRAAQNYTC